MRYSFLCGISLSRPDVLPTHIFPETSSAMEEIRLLIRPSNMVYTFTSQVSHSESQRNLTSPLNRVPAQISLLLETIRLLISAPGSHRVRSFSIRNSHF